MLFRFLVANMLKSQAQDVVRNKVEEVVTEQARNLEEMKQGREMPPCDVAIVFANHLGNSSFNPPQSFSNSFRSPLVFESGDEIQVSCSIDSSQAVSRISINGYLVPISNP